MSRDRTTSNTHSGPSTSAPTSLSHPLRTVVSSPFLRTAVSAPAPPAKRMSLVDTWRAKMNRVSHLEPPPSPDLEQPADVGSIDSASVQSEPPRRRGSMFRSIPDRLKVFFDDKPSSALTALKDWKEEKASRSNARSSRHFSKPLSRLRRMASSLSISQRPADGADDEEEASKKYQEVEALIWQVCQDQKRAKTQSDKGTSSAGAGASVAWTELGAITAFDWFKVKDLVQGVNKQPGSTVDIWPVYIKAGTSRSHHPTLTAWTTSSSTSGNLKHQLLQSTTTSLQLSDLVLYHQGRVLNDDKTLASQGVGKDSTIWVNVRTLGGGKRDRVDAVDSEDARATVSMVEAIEDALFSDLVLMDDDEEQMAEEGVVEAEVEIPLVVSASGSDSVSPLQQLRMWQSQHAVQRDADSRSGRVVEGRAGGAGGGGGGGPGGGGGGAGGPDDGNGGNGDGDDDGEDGPDPLEPLDGPQVEPVDDRPPDLNQCQGGPGVEVLNALQGDRFDVHAQGSVAPSQASTAIPPQFYNPAVTRGPIAGPGVRISSVVLAGGVQLFQRIVARPIHNPSSLGARLDWKSRRSVVVIDGYDCIAKAKLWHVQVTAAVFRQVVDTPFGLVIDVYLVNQYSPSLTAVFVDRRHTKIPAIIRQRQTSMDRTWQYPTAADRMTFERSLPAVYRSDRKLQDALHRMLLLDRQHLLPRSSRSARVIGNVAVDDTGVTTAEGLMVDGNDVKRAFLAAVRPLIRSKTVGTISRHSVEVAKNGVDSLDVHVSFQRSEAEGRELLDAFTGQSQTVAWISLAPEGHGYRHVNGAILKTIPKDVGAAIALATSMMEVEGVQARAGLIAITLRHTSGLSRLIAAALYLPAPMPNDALWRSMTVMRNLLGRRFGFRLEVTSRSLTMGMGSKSKGKGKAVVIPMRKKYASLLDTIRLNHHWLSNTRLRQALQEQLRKLVGDDEPAVWDLVWDSSAKRAVAALPKAPVSQKANESIVAAADSSSRKAKNKKQRFGNLWSA